MANVSGGSIVWNLDVNDSKFKAGLKSASSEANKLGDDISGAEGKSNGAFDRLGKGAIGLGKTMAAGLAVGAAAVGAVFIGAIKATAELEQNIGGSEAVFNTFASSIQESAKSAFDTAGISASDYLQTANKMGSLFKGAGLDTAQSLKLTTDSMQRAADVASVMGVSTDEALMAITGAAKGNFTMMDNLGVKMTATSLEAAALAKGMNKPFDAMTEGEKVMLATQVFMDSTGHAAGNFAKENDTLAGSFTSLKAGWENFMSGSEGGLEDFIGAFTNFVDVLVAQLPTILPKIVTGLETILTTLIDSLPKLLETLLPSLITGALNLILALVRALPKIIPILVTGFVQLFMGIVKALPEILPPLLLGLSTLITSLITELTKPEVLQLLMEASITLLMALIEALPVIIEQFAVALPAMINGIVDFLTRPATIKMLFNAGVDLFMALVKAVPQIVGSLFKAVGDVISGVGSSIKDGFKAAINWVIDKWNDLSFTVGGGNVFGKDLPSFTLDTPNIPRLAQGGIIPATQGGRLALVGEGGEDEAVIPLSKLRDMNLGGGEGGNVQVTVNMQGIMARSRTDLRDIGVDLIEAVNEGLRAKNLPQIGGGKIMEVATNG